MITMIGIDLGISSFKAVQLEKGKIKKKKRVFLNEEGTEKQIKKFFSDSFFSRKKEIALTGANAEKAKKLFGKKFEFVLVNEIQAIAKGSGFLSKEKNFLAGSIGTGTCFVSVKKNKASHIGGTALGGKTILGLSELITKEKDFKKIEESALKGKAEKTDLMLFDVYSKGIGLLKKNVPVAHFGRIKSNKKTDLNAGIINMICQGISLNALFAAKALKQKKIVFSGSLAESRLFKKVFKDCRQVFDLAEGIFVNNAGFASAIGAGLIAGKK